MTADARGNDRLLPRSRSSGPGPATAALSADSPDHRVEVAELDLDGVIVLVNQAWEAFAVRNGGDPLRTGVGVSYLDACASVPENPAVVAIRQALAGDLPAPVTVEVPCHSPETLRWYDMLIAPRHDSRGQLRGATVTLSLARSQSWASRDQEWLALADELTGHLFRIGLRLRAADGKPDEVARQCITEAVDEVDAALHRLRAAAFRSTAQTS